MRRRTGRGGAQGSGPRSRWWPPPDHPRMARIRAHQHRRPVGLCAAGRRALSAAARRAVWPVSGAARAALHHAVQLRRGLARSGGADADHHGRERPGLGVLGRGGTWQADRRAERAGARHRRHHRQVLADRGRHGPHQDRLLDRARPDFRRAIRSWCRWSTWSRSAMAAARSPGSTTSASCMSGRSRRARMPGPAAYGRGGTEATTTDANLWLGRINRDYFCGGEVDGRHGRGEQGARRGGRNGWAVDRDEAARGIVRIANNNMVNALKLVSLNRGHRSARLHAGRLWRRRRDAWRGTGAGAGRQEGGDPGGGSVFSAWGMMMSDLRRDYFVTRLADLGKGAATGIEAVFAETEAAAREQFEAEGHRRRHGSSFLRYGKFRYQNQEHTTEVELPGRQDHRCRRLAEIAANFHDSLRAGIHLPAGCAGRDGRHPPRGLRRGRQARDAARSALGDQPTQAGAQGQPRGRLRAGGQPRGRRSTTATRLEPGMAFTGPAIIEDPGTTVVRPPRQPRPRSMATATSTFT